MKSNRFEAQEQILNVTEAQLLACEHLTVPQPLLVVSGRVVGVAFPRILFPRHRVRARNAQAPPTSGADWMV